MKGSLLLLGLVAVLGALCAAASAQPTGPAGPRGTVTDETGAPIAEASVRIVDSSSRLRVTTNAAGAFEFPPGVLSGTLVVEAPGFRSDRRDLAEGAASLPIAIVLLPEAVSERVNVTATRTPSRLADTAASVTILNSTDLLASAAPALDEAIRQVPAFSLFRRSGSRTANPTSQGVSLRGVGASGASRAAVLDEGVPLNDPFGGWVYWARVPRAAVERIEVLRGGASDLYGTAALGGAIQLIRRVPGSPFTLFLESSYGSLDTPEASLFAGSRRGNWEFALSAEAFQTDGYVPVDARERGPADAPANSRHETVDLTVARSLSSGRVFLRGAWFDEERENGTRLQENDTETLALSAGGDWSVLAGSLSLRGYATDQRYRQSFSAIAPDRASERLTRLQEVPATSAGLSAQWSGALWSRHLVVAGLESRALDGKSNEDILTATGSSFVDSGGEEETISVFLEDVLTASTHLTLTAGLRFDRWWNEEGAIASRASPRATPAVTRLPDRSETAWSPRVSILYRVSNLVSLSASAYRSFRAPTLNELYRSFRVGDVLTLASAALGPERLAGVDSGVAIGSASGRLSARANLFWMEIEDAIGNVTLSVTPTLITRERRNIGKTRSRGLEIDFEARFGARWRFTGGYQFADSTVRAFPEDPGLEDLRVPQVPRHRASLRALYAHPSVADFAVSARCVSSQFEDDQNRLPLSSFWTLDALASRGVARGLDVFAAVENALDEEYEIGRTPVRTLGPPRLFRAGFRLRLPS